MSEGAVDKTVRKQAEKIMAQHRENWMRRKLIADATARAAYRLLLGRVEEKGQPLPTVDREATSMEMLAQIALAVTSDGYDLDVVQKVIDEEMEAGQPKKDGPTPEGSPA